jgi:hypothetical protein
MPADEPRDRAEPGQDERGQEAQRREQRERLVPAEARPRQQRGDLVVGRVDAPRAELDQASAQVAPRAHRAEPLAAHDPLEALGLLARARARARRGEQQHPAPESSSAIAPISSQTSASIATPTSPCARARGCRTPAARPTRRARSCPAGSAVMRPR